MDRKVAIIGAGISGLLACKYTLSKGYTPIVFEARDSIGGVWTQTFASTKLQSPKILYEFSDFPWPDSVTEECPGHQQINEYIQSYASHFDLLRHIKFNTKVVSISYEGVPEEEMKSWSLWSGTGEAFNNKGKWNINVQDMSRGHPTDRAYQVDFVILCVGRFSDVPNIPKFPPGKGPEAFQGEVIHTMEYAAMDDQTAAKFIKGKRVTVVGVLKSAMDIAVESSTANGVEKPTTMLYRTEHWPIADFTAWGVPLGFLFFNRFAELLIHKPGEGFLLSLLATTLTPLRWAISKFVESSIKWKVPLAKHGMVPKHSFFDAMNFCEIARVPEKFYERVEEGKILLKKSQGFSFCKEGILIDGESSPIESDVVILATGYRGDIKISNIFESPTFKDCITGTLTTPIPLYRGDIKISNIFESPTFKDCITGTLTTPIPLYRGCIPPKIPQLAIVGFAESIANLQTAELNSRWVAELLDGAFKLPSTKEMEKDIVKWVEFTKRYAGKNYQKSCVSLVHIWYSDQLCKDMGLNPKRKKGFFAELFEPYGHTDYAP